MCGLVNLIRVFGLVMIMLVMVVKLVVMFLVVGLVSKLRYGMLCLLRVLSVIVVFVICISESVFFCIWVLLFVVMSSSGVWFFVVYLVVWVIFLFIMLFMLLFEKVKFIIVSVIGRLCRVVVLVRMVLGCLVLVWVWCRCLG